MTASLYVVGLEPGSGKSIVALGLMEMLTRSVGQAGYFRPVIRAGPRRDPAIELVLRRYPLAQEYAQSFGVTTDDTRDQGASVDPHVVSVVLDRFSALAAGCEAVLVEGTDFVGASAAFEFTLNAELARNLGSAALVVTPAGEHRPEQIVGALRAAADALGRYRVPLAGFVVTRLPAGTDVVSLARAEGELSAPVWLLPEVPILTRPTLHDVVTATEAQVLLGDPAALTREVDGVTVAAMGVPALLGRLRSGALVITPGDRVDVLVTLLAGRFSDTGPRVAGVLLTGGIRPDDAVLDLARGMRGAELPVLFTQADTYATATRVAAIRPELTADDERKLAAALGLVEGGIDGRRLAERVRLVDSPVVTPTMFAQRLVARARTDRRRIVLPEGDDDRILQAADRLLRRDAVDLTILGDRAAVATRADVLGLDLNRAVVVDPEAEPLRSDLAAALHALRAGKGLGEHAAYDLVGDVSYFGTMLVATGRVDGMVSGALHTTAHTIRPALQLIRTEPGVSVVSSVFLMALADRVLVYGDCAVNPDPDAHQLADIALSSARTARAFGVDPYVAMLSYSTGDSGSGADVDKVREATALVRSRAPDLPVEGPIQYDAAVDPAVARVKLPGSPVAGRATVFVFPDLNTGNNTYKAVQRTAHAVAIGPVLQGLRLPVNDLSRGATVDDIVNTVVITAIQAQQARG